MNKKNYLWWAVGLVVLILAVYLLATLTTPATETPATPENPTGQTEANGNPFDPTGVNPAANSAVAPTPVPNTPAPVVNKNPKAITAPEFMSDKEKEALKIDKATKVQILQRLSDGTIGAYKVIHNDSDILTSF